MAKKTIKFARKWFLTTNVWLGQVVCAFRACGKARVLGNNRVLRRTGGGALCIVIWDPHALSGFIGPKCWGPNRVSHRMVRDIYTRILNYFLFHLFAPATSVLQFCL